MNILTKQALGAGLYEFNYYWNRVFNDYRSRNRYWHWVRLRYIHVVWYSNRYFNRHSNFVRHFPFNYYLVRLVHGHFDRPGDIHANWPRFWNAHWYLHLVGHFFVDDNLVWLRHRHVDCVRYGFSRYVVRFVVVNLICLEGVAHRGTVSIARVGGRAGRRSVVVDGLGDSGGGTARYQSFCSMAVLVDAVPSAGAGAHGRPLVAAGDVAAAVGRGAGAVPSIRSAVIGIVARAQVG